MEKIVEYITLNYTWFLGGSIIILLAIIGYYADKTNFGQGKPKEVDKPKDIEQEKNDNTNLRLNDIFDPKENKELEINNIQNINGEQIDNKPNMNFDTMTGQPINQNVNTTNNENLTSEVGSLNFSEASFEKFDKEFEEVLPKKQIIDDELLDEINNLSLDKTQRIELSDIPDLDDLELPKIKPLTKEEEDIWKF